MWHGPFSSECGEFVIVSQLRGSVMRGERVRVDCGCERHSVFCTTRDTTARRAEARPDPFKRNLRQGQFAEGGMVDDFARAGRECGVFHAISFTLSHPLR